MQEFFQNNSTVIVFSGLFLVTMALMMRISKRHRQSHTHQEGNRPEEIRTRNRELAGTRGQLEDLMVEIEQMAKRMGSQLDAKSIRMEKLLDEAEQRIAELRQLADEATGARQRDRSAAQVPSSPPASLAEVSSAVHSEAVKMSASSEDSQMDDKESSEQSANSSDPLAASVYELADAGMDAIGIARQLNEHVGKVELILALRGT